MSTRKLRSSLKTIDISNDDLECAVCLQTCIHPVKLPCSHIFCFLCVKGIANISKRCAMCRQEIPPSFLDNPNLLKALTATAPEVSNDHYQWFYEGRNGWWQYDERTNEELEIAYNTGNRSFEILVAGFLYTIDFDRMIQHRRNDPSRRRRIKRDISSIPKKGIAGLKTDALEPGSSSNSANAPSCSGEKASSDNQGLSSTQVHDNRDSDSSQSSSGDGGLMDSNLGCSEGGLIDNLAISGNGLIDNFGASDESRLSQSSSPSNNFIPVDSSSYAFNHLSSPSSWLRRRLRRTSQPIPNQRPYTELENLQLLHSGIHDNIELVNERYLLDENSGDSRRAPLPHPIDDEHSDNIDSTYLLNILEENSASTVNEMDSLLYNILDGLNIRNESTE